MSKVLDYSGLEYVARKVMDLVNSGCSADYVIEQGSSGIWTYRKWASGYVECFGVYTATMTHYSGPTNGFYAYYRVGNSADTTYYDSKLVFPFHFYELYAYNFSGAVGSGFAIPVSAELGLGHDYGTIRFLSSTSGSQSITARIYVTGTWKENFTPSVVRSAMAAPALVYKRVLTSSDNVNDIKECGIYYIADSVPTGLDYYGEARTYSYLLVISHTSDFVEQIYIRPQTQNFMMRTYSGAPASWGSWKYMMSYSTCVSLGITNANSLVDNGFYTGNNLTNAPKTGWVVYQVMRHDNNPSYVNQIAYPIGDATKIYQRTLNGEGSWGSWSTH